MLEVAGYDVVQMLGFGGSGEVWLGRCRRTGEAVALKRLHPGSDPSEVAALHREAELLAGVASPHVVRLREVVGDVLVLDHCAGGSLAALLRQRGRLEPGEVVTVAAPLAQALAAVHDGGLVHGDVTPSNVLLTADGRPVLTDFGAARPAGTVDGDVHGTAEYVDPAVALGADPTPASDVWALGALCHHLLAGSPPHEGVAVDDVLVAVREGGRAPLGLLAPSAPRALVAVVEAALVREPAARPSATALAAALLRACPPEPVRLVAPGAEGPGAEVPGAEVPGAEGPGAGVPGAAGDHLAGDLAAGPAQASGTSDDEELAPWDRPWWSVGGRPSPSASGSGADSPAVSGPGAVPGAGAAREPAAAAARGTSSSPRAGDEPVPSSLRETHRVPRPVRDEPLEEHVPWWSRVSLAALGLVLVALLALVGGLVWAVAGAVAEPVAVAQPVDAPAAEPVDAPAQPVDPPPLPAAALELLEDPQPEVAGPPALDWASVLDGLDAERERAFATGDARWLDRVHAAGSPGLVADRDALAQLAAAGLRAEGVRHDLQEVQELSRTGGEVRLRVVDVLGPQVLRRADGTAAEQRPGRPPAALVVVLRSTPDGWRLQQVAPG